MDLSRRALLVAAACLPQAAHAADQPSLTCPLAAAPTILVPGVANSFGTRLVGAQLYRGLLRWGPSGALEPDLATVDVSPDGLTYTAELRPGVTWHDSGGLSSADVAFSLTRFHRALQPSMQLGRIAVDVPGPLTVVLTLPAPDPGFLQCLEALSLPIVPQHVHDRAGWALDPRQTTPVGTGPFRYDRWLSLVRFEWYAGPKTALGGIDFPILAAPGARAAIAEGTAPALLVGDAVDMPSVPQFRAIPGLTVTAEYPPGLRTIAGLRFNIAARPLDQPEVRLALAFAIDRAAALREGWSGLGRAATRPLAMEGPGGSEEAVLPGYNPRVAADHLRAAGLRPDDTGIRARMTCLYPTGPAWPPMLGSVRRSLAQIGIDFVPEAVADAEWRRRVAAVDYSITVFTTDLGGDPPDAPVQALTDLPTLPLVEPGMPVVRPTRLSLPRGALASFAGAALA